MEYPAGEQCVGVGEHGSTVCRLPVLEEHAASHAGLLSLPKGRGGWEELHKHCTGQPLLLGGGLWSGAKIQASSDCGRLAVAASVQGAEVGLLKGVHG